MRLDNNRTVDFMNASGALATQHYAFLVSEAQFDAAFARIRACEQPYWADPYRRRPNEFAMHVSIDRGLIAA